MMARIVFLFLVIICLMNPAAAHAALGGRVALYSDAGLSECTLTDTSPRVADVYVVHSPVAYGAVGIMFKLAPSAGFDGTWIEDIFPPGMGGVGTSPSGIAVGSLSCWFNDRLVLHVRYQMQGASSSCSFVEAVPYPGFSWIITTTCGEGCELPVDGSRLLVNADESCPCEPPPLASESTTWGRIKAMYRN